MLYRIVQATVLAATLACAGQRRVRIRPVASRDLRGVAFLRYASSQAAEFFDAEGRACPPFGGQIREFFAGWQAKDQDEPACDHDTFEHAAHTAMLELRFEGSIPADGAWDLVSGGYAVGAWGRVFARGSYYGDYFAKARLELEARSPHCRALWTRDLAKAAITGSLTRGAEFSGWHEIPDASLDGCLAGEALEVRLRLLGESNRGRVEVDAFGFSMASADELGRVFGLRPAAPRR